MQQLVNIFLLLTLLVSSSFCCLAQEGQDSLMVDSTVVKKEKKVKFLFALNARRSFVLDRKTKFNGVKIGVTVKGKHKLGLGLYGMKNPIRIKNIPIDREKYPDASDTILFNFDYTSFFYEPIWYKTKRWEISSPFQLGIGSIKLSYRDTSNTKDVVFQDGGAPVLGVSASVEYKFFRWLAFGLGAGYRLILLKDDKIRNSVSAPIYNFQLKILFGVLYKMAFKKEKLEEW